jgi:hypothetical protein
MKKIEDGWIEPAAIFLLLFIAVLVFGAGTVFFANALYLKKNKQHFALKQDADKLLGKIVADFQELKEEKYDSIYHPYIENLLAGYKNYGLEIKDVSSGIHLDFLPDSDLSDAGISSYIFKNRNAADFIRYRNLNGLITDTEKLRPYVNEKIFDLCKVYGWLSASHENSFAFKTISNNFKTANVKELFPLVNNFPLININNINCEIVEIFIMRKSFSIPDVKEKYQILKLKMEQKTMLDDIAIASILSVPVTNKIFCYFGGKTSFWQVTFNPNAIYKVEAVIAAIPEEEGDQRKISRYDLIERRFISVR